MVNNMRTNLDHDVFIKKGKSIALANQVEAFLLAQGKSEPTQIPFGQSQLSMAKKEDEYKTGQQSMRESMAYSVSKKRPVLKPLEKVLTQEQQRHKFNFDQKLKALKDSQNTFTGKCQKHGETTFRVYPSTKKHHCLACKAETFNRRKGIAA